MAPAEALKTIKEEEVALHDKEEDCWLVIGDDSNGGEKVHILH